MKIDKSRLDVSQIFLVFMAVVGDVDKTATALDLDPEIVRSLAQSEGWAEKIRRISVMSKGGKPGDWERAQNRALNFVQAHRVRSMIDKLITHYATLNSDDLAAELQTGRAGERSPSAKFLADLMSAAERAHALSYMALGDTVTEREARTDEDGNSVSAATLHASLIAALNNPCMRGVEADLLVKEAASVVDENVKQLAPPPSEIDRG